MSRLDEIAFHFAQGGVIQAEDARWLIKEAAFAAEIRRGLEPFRVFHPSLFDPRRALDPRQLVRLPSVSPAKVSIKHLPPEGEMARMEVTVTHEVTPR